MKLDEYLRKNRETRSGFAERIGVTRQSVIAICAGGGTLASTAEAIIDATGGLVRLGDLTGKRKAKTRRRAR